MIENRRRNVCEAGTVISGNGIIGNHPMQNNGQSSNPTVVMLVNVTAVSGSPTMTLQLQGAMRGDSNYYAIADSAGNVNHTITATGLYRFVFPNVLEYQLQVYASSVAGTLTCSIDLLLTSPDS
jgi:hypothetical protein